MRYLVTVLFVSAVFAVSGCSDDDSCTNCTSNQNDNENSNANGNNTNNNENSNTNNNQNTNGNTTDPCEPNPCQNGGRCIPADDGSFQCECPEGYSGPLCEQEASQPQPDLGPDARVIFLHHSTGGVIWRGGVAQWFQDYNAQNGTSYEVSEIAYPHDPYPWANYPYDYWHLWVEGGGQAQAEGQESIEDLAANYEVVVFKHCFPVSHIQEDTGNPDVSSERKSLENYKLQYAALKERLRQFPDTRFIVWTGAALVESATNPDEAQRAQEFFRWVIEDWDEPGDNIYVWDFYSLETEGGLYLKPEYAAGPSDSHPNDTFARQVAPLFAQRIVDVITGYGDLRSITGQD